MCKLWNSCMITLLLEIIFVSEFVASTGLLSHLVFRWTIMVWAQAGNAILEQRDTQYSIIEPRIPSR